jgi:hypothetical protein
MQECEHVRAKKKPCSLHDNSWLLLQTETAVVKLRLFFPSTYNNCNIETCLLSLHVSSISSHHQVPEF